MQRVVRPNHTFRGFAGQIASGTVRVGDEIAVLPSRRSAKIERIVTFDGDLDEAVAPLSVTLVLDRELDISRGDLIAAAEAPATVARGVKASLVWMDQRPLDLNRRYLLKHTSHTVPAFLSSIDYRVDLGTLTREPALALRMNDIGAVSLHLLRPIAVDLYGENRNTGALILIDAETNRTVAAGMVTAAFDSTASGEEGEAAAWGRVTAGEREARWGHRGGVLRLARSHRVDRRHRTLAVCRGRSDQPHRCCRGHILLHPVLLDSDRACKPRVGLLALVVRANEDGALRRAPKGAKSRSMRATPCTRWLRCIELLRSAGIFISTEMADL